MQPTTDLYETPPLTFPTPNGHPPMKILYLCPDLGIPVLGRKGASIHVRGLINAFRRSGHKVVLAAQLLNKSYWEEPAILEVPMVELKLTSSTMAAILALKAFNLTLGMETTLPAEMRRILFNHEIGPSLKRRFENDPPDFIYERASLYGTAGAWLAQELNVPLLLELNAPLALEQSTYRATMFGPIALEAERFALSRADAILTVSRPLRDHILSLGVEPSRVHLFPNGVDPALFRPSPRDLAVRAQLGLSNELVVGFVGGLRAWHGVELLPEILQQLLPQHPQVRLIVVGDGPLRTALEERLRALGISDKAMMVGSLPHTAVAAVIQQFDVAIAPYPPLDHAFYFSPLKVFEYMACGVPVVATDQGQLTELIRHGETGLLCPPGDVAALTAACDRLLSDRALRTAMGEAAAKSVQTNFTWDHNARRAIELARTLIVQRKSMNQERNYAESIQDKALNTAAASETLYRGVSPIKPMVTPAEILSIDAGERRPDNGAIAAAGSFSSATGSDDADALGRYTVPMP